MTLVDLNDLTEALGVSAGPGPIDREWADTDYAEELPPEMNVGGGHSHWAGVSSGSSSSSSSTVSSVPYNTMQDPMCYIEDICYLLKLIIELYDLDEIKPLYYRMSMDYRAEVSMYRYRYRYNYKEPKKEEKHLDDELFKI